MGYFTYVDIAALRETRLGNKDKLIEVCGGYIFFRVDVVWKRDGASVSFAMKSTPMKKL